MAAAIDVIRRPAPPYEGRFLHRDFQPGNVLFDVLPSRSAGARITGVVDWAAGSWGPADLDVAHSDWAKRYGARIDSYRFPKGDNVRQEWAEQVGRDGFTILDAIDAPDAPRWLWEIPAVQVLGRAWGEQYHRDDKGVRWQEGKDLPPGRSRLASPYDTDARYSTKRSMGWCGYKTHLSEICEPDAPRPRKRPRGPAVNHRRASGAGHKRSGRQNSATGPVTP